MRGHALRAAVHVHVHRFDIEMIVANPRHDAVGALALDDAGGAALQDLRRMPRRTGPGAHHEGHRGEQRGVRRAPCQHDLRAVLDGRRDRLVSHHADDMGALVDDLLADRRRRIERRNAALSIAALEIVLILLAAHQRHLELEAIFLRDLQSDVAHPGNASIAAAEAARADDNRDIELRPAAQHEAQVALGALMREVRFATAEMRGAGIGRTAVAGDNMGFQRNSTLKRGFEKSRADLAGGR